ncbi:amino acid permease [Colletotrichum karsti]|uniref:Amino acid permease n=1 Tax=Colletotrichum karsti TaxID=1095194 RepID=A0A9P6I6B7_9PEZI|nr:amino acid permease [Colletotrichum karsti]KAF9872800.1 amino acid permease [Colletotrichum karsti]
MATDPKRVSGSTPEWLPDWFLGPDAAEMKRNASPAPPTSIAEGSSDGILGHKAIEHAANDGNENNENNDGFTERPGIEILVKPEPDRTVKRKLRGIHLFMITINGTLGTGLYWRSGQILELGGPLAVLFSFVLVGLLAWAVMQCVTELLCIWPVPGALSVYVSTFVDPELGIAVGVAYWFTYSVSFAALIATSSALMNFWINKDDQGLSIGLVYVLIPIIMVAVNSFGIEVGSLSWIMCFDHMLVLTKAPQIYGWIEVATGGIKIAFLAVIVVALIAITGEGSASNGSAIPIFKDPFQYDKDAASNWGVALLMSLSIAAFAYVGVEIVAASALEAKWPEPRRHLTQQDPQDDSQRSSPETLIGRTVKFSAIFISVLVAVAYTLSGMLVSLNIEPNDCALPHLSWVKNTTSCEWMVPEHRNTHRNSTSSAFVVIAGRSSARVLDHVFNFFLVFTALTCANTNLYVASRSLFGLTSRLDGGAGQPWVLRTLAWFGRTNSRKVPLRAMVFSALAFWWVPFLQISGGTDTSTPVGMFIEILAQMGSAGVVIVWACQCLAFIRYYHCIDRHRHALESRKIPQVQRWNSENRDYPYHSHGQPFLAYMAFISCVFLLLVSNGAAVWKSFNLLPFLSAYLAIFVFLALWVCLKLFRGAKWSFCDLSDRERVIKIIRHLHERRAGTV